MQMETTGANTRPGMPVSERVLARAPRPAYDRYRYRFLRGIRDALRQPLKAVAAWMPLIVPSLIFAFHALLFRHWIIDDAGISYAYARNLAEGHGLVQQPGLSPVEAYSNFLWVLLLTPIFLIRMFHPVVAPKLLSILLVFGSFVLVLKTLTLLCGRAARHVTLLTLTLCAANTPFVVWTTSGLENPLNVWLQCFLLWCCADSMVRSHTRRRNALLAGFIVAAISMTRPEGFLFVFLYPTFVAMGHLRGDRTVEDSSNPALLRLYLVTLAAPVGLFLLFRILYFGDLLPNTYYAKASGGISRNLLAVATLQPRIVSKTLDLMASFAGKFGTIILIALVTRTISLVRAQRFRPEFGVVLTFLLLSFAAYILLPDDWMGEYRFASSFYVFLYAYAVMLGYDFLYNRALGQSASAVLTSSVIAFVVLGSFLLFGNRSLSFARNPPTPFTTVATRFGILFNRDAAQLGLDHASILTADAGGTLYYSTLRFYDLAGLCDRVIASTLGKDQRAFYDYVFDVIKPTFIAVPHPWFAHVAAFDEDKRFRRDYVALYEYPSAVDGTISAAGYFVRRDAVGNRQDSLHEIQRDFERHADLLRWAWRGQE